MNSFLPLRLIRVNSVLRTFVLSFLLISFNAHSATKEDVLETIEQCAPLSYKKIMKSIALRESSFNPFAINLNGAEFSKRHIRSKEEATRFLEMLKTSDVNFDAGLMQINSYHFRSGGYLSGMGYAYLDLLDPCKSVVMSSLILKEAHDRTGDIISALSIYNTGNSKKGLENGYVEGVIKNLERF